MRAPFICKTTNIEFISPATCFSGFLHLGPPSTCSSHPRARQGGTDPMRRSLLKVFMVASSKPACPASLISSRGNSSKGSWLLVPTPHTCLLPPEWPWYVPMLPLPHGMMGPLFLGSANITNCMYNGSHFLICWLCHTWIIIKMTF